MIVYGEKKLTQTVTKHGFLHYFKVTLNMLIWTKDRLLAEVTRRAYFFSPHFHVWHIKYARTKIPENREKNIESIYSNKFWHRPVVYTKPNKWAMLACSLLPTINVSKAHSPTFKQQSKKVHFFLLSQSFLKPCEIRVVHQFCSVLTVTLLTSVENWLEIEQLQKWQLVHHLFSQNWQEHEMKGKWQTKKCKIILTFF